MSAAKERVIFLKLSGERLGEDGSGWDADSVVATSQKLAQAYELSEGIAIEGIVLVSGAGNIIRGEKLKERGIAGERADMLGRLGTIMNSLVISEALKDLGIPTAIFIAKGMAFKNGGFEIEEYSSKNIKKAFGEGKIVLIAGGSGKDNVTTDYAVALWAGDYHNEYPDTEVTVLKGTKLDGVFEDDPAKVKGVRCYRMIGAPMMQREYERFSAVDERSLQEIIDSGLEMLVYADEKHDIEAVLRHDLKAHLGGGAIGTLIVARDIEPVFY